MSRPRQRFYPPDEPPPDVARQQRLELENAALRREVGTLKDVLRVTARTIAPYLPTKPKPDGRR